MRYDFFFELTLLLSLETGFSSLTSASGTDIDGISCLAGCSSLWVVSSSESTFRFGSVEAVKRLTSLLVVSSSSFDNFFLLPNVFKIPMAKDKMNANTAENDGTHDDGGRNENEELNRRRNQVQAIITIEQ